MSEELKKKLIDYANKYDLTTFRIDSDDLKTNVWSLIHLVYISNKFKREIKKQIILNIEKYQVVYRDSSLLLEGYFTIDQLRDVYNIDNHILFAVIGEKG